MEALLHKSRASGKEVISLERTTFGGNSPMTSNNKRSFARALKLQDDKTSFDFVWCKQLSTEELPLRGINFNEVGPIQLPVPAKDIEKLKLASEKSPYGKGFNVTFDPTLRQAWEIDFKKVISTIPKNLDLSPLVVNQLNFPVEMINFDIQLDKVVLYETGSHFKRTHDSLKQFATWGTMILQIPVEEGHDGGNLMVNFKGKTQTFENRENSHQHFYMTTFCNGCEHSMEPITKGQKLTLVFDLLWTNPKIEVPQDISAYIATMKEIKKALTPWIYQHVLDFSAKKHHTSISQVTPEPQLPDPPDSDRDDGEVNYDSIHIDQEACEENLLYFVLEEKYNEANLTFNDLRGNDQNLANLLQNCFFDVHLAMVEIKNSREKYDWSNARLSFEIPRWINADNILTKLNLQIDWKKQRIGPIRKLLTTKEMKPDKQNKWSKPHDIQKTTKVCNKEDYDDEDENDEDEDDEGDDVQDTWENLSEEEPIIIYESYFYHYVLVIWPKHQSFLMHCRYGMGSLLHRMERSLSSCTQKNPLRDAIRQQVALDLQKIISFCHEEHQKAWGRWSVTYGKMGRGELTFRLLRLCIALRARHEGLTLLNMIATDLSDDPEFRFEGIQNSQVAQAIAQFQTEVAGWEDCADFIKRLVSPTRISSQLAPIIQLASSLLDSNCMEGVKLIENCVSTFLVDIKKDRADDLDFSGVIAYVNFLISLESNPETSSHERFTPFKLIYPKLKFSILCHLVLHFEKGGCQRLKNIHSCKLMFDTLCETLVACSWHTSYLTIELSTLVELLCAYARLGNADWLRSLVSSICCVPVNSAVLSLRRKLITSPELITLTKISELGKFAATSLVVEHWTQLMGQQTSGMLGKDERKILDGLTSCLKILLKMERSSLENSPPISLQLNPEVLNLSQLCSLLIGSTYSTYYSLDTRLFTHKSCLKILQHICQLILQKFQRVNDEDAIMLGNYTMLRTLNCFMQLRDESLTRSLVVQFCTMQVTKTKEFFSLLVASSDQYNFVNLDPSSKLIVLNACAKLVETWIVEADQLYTKSANQNHNHFFTVRSKICDCTKLFFLAERSRFEESQKNVASTFQPLLAKLSTSQLMDTVLSIFSLWESKSSRDTMSFPVCLKWCSEIFGMLLNQDFLPFVKSSEVALKIFECLFWLDVELLWQSFSRKLCLSYPTNESCIFFQTLLYKTKLHGMILESWCAFSAVKRIMDHVEVQSNLLKEPVFTWQQPQATVLNHPEVQEFLRSDTKSMVYSKFECSSDARGFAKLLEEMGASNKFCVKVIPSGTRKSSRCVITKVKSNNYEQEVESFQERRSQASNLVKLRNSLQNQANFSNQATDSTSVSDPDNSIVLVETNENLSAHGGIKRKFNPST